MKHCHIPTFVIFGTSVFCISEKHVDLAYAIQSCWTGAFVILISTLFLLRLCRSHPITLPKNRILKTICLIGLLEIIYAMLQLFNLVPDNYPYAYFSGSLNNPAVFGMLLSFCMPISVYYALKTIGQEKTLWKLLTIVFAVFVVLSDSRTALISSFCGVSLVFILEQKTLIQKMRNKRIRYIGIACLCVVCVVLYFYKRDSADGRILIWNVCMDMIREKPLSGWGSDGYIANYMSYQAKYLTQHVDSPYILLAGETKNPFNEFLHIALICGIPCAVIFIGLLVYVIWHIYNKLEQYRSVLLGLVGIFLIWCLFSYPFNAPFVWLIVLFVILSMIPPTCHIPVPRLCYAAVIIACALCLYPLARAGSRDIRRICLQERAMNRFDEETIEEYESMYKEFSDDGLFLYNYGAMLHLHGEYKKSLEVFHQCSKYINDYNMMLLMGDDYQQLELPDSALEYYQRASKMILCRYLPLYYQMKVYQEQGEYEKARKIATTILCKKNKIEKSKVAQEVVRRARECLN